ncbi:MAG: hypothetical protein LKE51_01675 [Selenomonas sp.]|jgi:hypothetical protein|nr:hypothetical protein [Selenomonas sp.]
MESSPDNRLWTGFMIAQQKGKSKIRVVEQKYISGMVDDEKQVFAFAEGRFYNEQEQVKMDSIRSE